MKKSGKKIDMKKNLFSKITSLSLFVFLTQSITAQEIIKAQHVPGSACHDCPASQNNNLKIFNPTPQNGNGSVATTYTATACGINYVLGSAVIEQRTNGIVTTPPPGQTQPATISISGIPPCATITKAFLYADASGNGVAVTAALQNPSGGSANFPMTIIGQDQDKCWNSAGYASTYSYRADVTSIVTSNGNYVVSGFPVAPSAPGPNDIDGCTLVIIYSDPGAAYTGSIVIADGAHTTIGPSISDNISGFSACGNSTSGSCFMCIGDLQGLATTTISGTYNFSYPSTSNAWWDCIVNPISVTSGQSSAAFTFANGGDCFNVVAVGMYFQTNCNLCSSPTMSVTASNNSFCGNTGAIAVVTGGAAPYTYTWTGTSQTTDTVGPIAVGIQIVTVADSTGCNIATDTVLIQVNPNPPLQVNSPGVCPGDTTIITVTGASTYTWSPATGLSATTGSTVYASPTVTTTYTITGTIGACTGTVTSTVTVSAGGLAINASGNDTICLGGNSLLTVTGQPATYVWMPGSISGTSITVSPTSSTTFTVVGTNTAGCTGKDSVLVNVPPTMSLSVSDSNITCNSLCNAMAMSIVTPSSGQFSNYSFSWSNGQTTANTSHTLCAGTYALTVTDGGGCVVKDSVTITEPAALTATSTQTNVLCNGASTGSATVTVSGGTAAYTYQWSAGSGPGTSHSNLAAGVCTVIIHDAHNCSDTVTITIAQPPAISATLTATNINCINSAGSITSNVSGGTPSYNYSWSPSGSGQNPSGLTAGSYTLTLTDANNCAITKTISITSNTNPPNVNAGVNDTLNCGAGASVNLNGTSSTVGVTYLWQGPGGFSSTQKNPAITSAGTYTLSVVNPINGCASVDTVIIDQAFINASFTENPAIGNYPLSVGFVNTSTSTGTANYNWNFGNGNSSSNVNDSSLYPSPGTYVVTLIATNNYGCIDTATNIVIVTEPFFILVPNVFTPNGDGNNDVFFIKSAGISSLQIDILNRWGEKMYEITSVTGSWNGKSSSGSEAPDGTYYYLLTAKGTDGKDYSKEGYILLNR